LSFFRYLFFFFFFSSSSVDRSFKTELSQTPHRYLYILEGRDGGEERRGERKGKEGIEG